MTVSANSSFDLSADQIVTLAYQLVLGVEVNVTANMLTFGRTSLNVVCKALQNEGVELRTRERYTQTLTAGTAVYSTPSDTIDVLSPGAFVSSSGGVDFPLETRSMADYMGLTIKTTQAQPTQLYVERGTTSGTVTLTLYPVPDSGWVSFTYPRVRMLRDWDTGTVTGDFPSRYIKALTYGVASEIAESSGLPDKVKRTRIVFEAEKSKALNEDGEHGPVRFVVQMPYYGGYRR